MCIVTDKDYQLDCRDVTALLERQGSTMATVTSELLDSINSAPLVFREKTTAAAFLQEDKSIDRKKDLALELLESLADEVGCTASWRILVKDRLVAAEAGMKYLLPAHRDHIIHSAHLYLLGVLVYLRMLRSDPVSCAALADSYYLDAQALHAPLDIPYSCLTRIIWSTQSVPAVRSTLPSPYRMDPEIADKLRLNCSGCRASSLASEAHSLIAASLADPNSKCRIKGDLLYGFMNLDDAMSKVDGVVPDLEHYLPSSQEEVDQVFRRRWVLISLFHDAAYPLELAAHQMEDYLSKTIAPLGCTFSPCKNPFGLALNRMCDFVAIPLVQNICSSRFNPVMYKDNAAQLVAANLSHKLHVGYSPETLATMMVSWLESGMAQGKLDHGVFSALLMLKHLNHEITDRLGEKRYSSDPIHDDTRRIVAGNNTASAIEFFYIECVDAAAAIYLHNTKKYIDLLKAAPLEFLSHPYAWLLFLCDQLQEWCRPSGNDGTDSLQVLRDCAKYKVMFDTKEEPAIYIDYPPSLAGVGTALNEHLTLYGKQFLKQTHNQQ